MKENQLHKKTQQPKKQLTFLILYLDSTPHIG